MNETRSKSSDLRHVAQQHPPSGIVLVGAGCEGGKWRDLILNHPDAACLLVEADHDKCGLLKASTAGSPSVRVLNAVVTKDPGEVDFHKMTLSGENSIIAPNELRGLWPNIRILEAEKRQGTPLRLIEKNGLPAVDWLIVDCLPALPIIEGFADGLGSLHVIIARVTLFGKEVGPRSSSLDALRQFLARQKFELHALWDTRHPKMAHACFTRAEATADEKPKGASDNAASDTDLGKRLKRMAAIEPCQKNAADPTSLEYYRKFDRKYAKSSIPPFVLIDSKSLPRSGLHYLKDILAKLLDNQFSFCEWYQEIGCCHKHPCSLHAFADYAGSSGKFRLRLTKSHDFSHTDPAIPTSRVLQRVVLVRDPLFILTSWFELDQLAKNRASLLEQGIDIRKIWLMHEKELQLPAYGILDRLFIPPSDAEFTTWLLDKADYINRFLMDWAGPNLSENDPFHKVVMYEEIDAYVKDLLSPYREWLSDESIRALDRFTSTENNSFQKRCDPFALHSGRLEAYVREKKHLFEEVIGHIIRIPNHHTSGD